MRILLLADLHSDEYALERIRNICSAGKFDYALVAGDITKGAISFLEDVLDALPNCLAIPGNCDPPQVLEILEKRGRSVHKKRIALSDGFNIVGFGLSPPTPFHTYGELEESEIRKEMTMLDVDEKTLLLTHAPPYGIFDVIRGGHIGSKAIMHFIEAKKPFANFCGHVHEHEGVSKIGKTTVVKIPAANAGHYAVATISDKKLSIEFCKM